MAFVNELASEQDVEKFDLDQLLREFNPFKWRNGRPPIFVHAWTVDRERDAYFFPAKTIEKVGPSGRPETTQGKVCILSWQGGRAVATIDRSSTSSIQFSDSPFRIIWRLVDLETSRFKDVPREKILELLKDALTVYGHRGIHQQVPGAIVEFNF